MRPHLRDVTCDAFDLDRLVAHSGLDAGERRVCGGIQATALQSEDGQVEVLTIGGDAVVAMGSVGPVLPAGRELMILTFDLGASAAGGAIQPQLQVTVGGAPEVPGSDQAIAYWARRSWFEEIAGPGAIEAGLYHLPQELRVVALALLQTQTTGGSRLLYLAAKGLELVCETLRLSAAGALAPCAAVGGLSLADSHRLMAARRMIAEQFSQKLTLDGIGRACGLNRAKLTRGFRELFDCSIGEALAERRLQEAAQQLRTTDKPVAIVGYDAGYSNNASFARAFARRFGAPPTAYRAAPRLRASPVTPASACGMVAA